MGRAALQRRWFDASLEALGPYVPSLTADWLRDQPAVRHRALTGTLVFADISGFTRLTEMLAARGKIGAEEMSGLINTMFDRLLPSAYEFGAGVIKYGGDAMLLLFDGPGHAQRACRGAHEMQTVMRREGLLQTSRGPLRLRMSIGVHSGTFEYLLLGNDHHRELVVTGPGLTLLTALEQAAGPGQIVVSRATAEELVAVGERPPAVALGDGLLLRSKPQAELREPTMTADYRGVALGVGVGEILRSHILAGGESEHRHVAVGFIRFSGVDALLSSEGPAALEAALEQVIRPAQAAAAANKVAYLDTDIGADGGKVMLSAGAPLHVGHHGDRMLATIRAVLDSGGPLALHAGMTRGRAFAGDVGTSYRRTYSLAGDCVNLAARLAQRAGDRELLAPPAVLKGATGTFAAMVRAPFHVKGKREPVLAMSLGSPMESRQAGAHDETPMIGRERELQILLDALRSAVAGSGRVVELVGPPGIGKSRLLNELRSRAAGEVLWAEGDVYTGARPYAPFERLLRLRWGALDETPPEVLAARLRATTEQRAPHLVPWLPLIAIAAGIELPSTPEVDATDAGVRKQRLEELASEWLGAILGEITVLIFNDVHLMDDASADLIGRLARDAATRPWLVVLSRRPERDSPLGDHAFERIELGPLSDSDSEQLLARATDDAPLPPHTLARLTDRAGGNPMFLRELAAQLHEGGDPGALPDSVEDAIAARIDRLAPADRRLLRSAAVLGVVVDVSLLSEVLRDDASAGPGTMTSRFEALSEFMQPLDPERRQFSHQLVREVAYEGLPYRRRTDLHARTAAAIERMAAGDLSQQAELLSLHCLHGAQFEAAWRYSRIAAEHAVERYASAEAADSYRRALAAANELQGLDQLEVAAVEESLGDVCFQLGEFRGAEVALRAALRRSAGRPTAKATIELKLSRIREWSGHRGAALRWLTRAERSLAGVSTREGRQILARITFRRSRIRYLQGRQAEALTLADKAIALAREASDRRTLADALELADLASVAMGATQEPVRAEQALAIYAELADLAGEARLLNALGMLAYHRGRWPEALARYRAAETAYSRSGNRFGASISAANVAEILGDQGCVTEARATMEQAMRVWRAAGATAEIAFGEAQLGQLAARLGDTEEALRRLAVARAFYDEAGEASEVLLVDAMTADAHTHAGRHAEALAIADRTLRRARDVPGVTVATPAAHRVRGIALAALGRHDEAGLALRAALAAARSREALHEIAFALRELIANGLADSPGERSAWVSEHESLCKELGLQMAAPT